jgi:hypothetical protein
MRPGRSVEEVARAAWGFRAVVVVPRAALPSGRVKGKDAPEILMLIA